MKRATKVPFDLEYELKGEQRREHGFDSYKSLEERIKELGLTKYSLANADEVSE